MIVNSFVDRDMVMRHFGGGIGHLKNAPPLQVPGLFDPIDPSSEEMPVEDDDDDPCGSGTNEDLGTVVQQSFKDVVNGGELVQLEDDKDSDNEGDDSEEDDDDSDGNESGDQTDEEEDEGGNSEDDYGYASQ